MYVFVFLNYKYFRQNINFLAHLFVLFNNKLYLCGRFHNLVGATHKNTAFYFNSIINLKQKKLMKVKASFLDETQVLVEIPDDDNVILVFSSSMNYQIFDRHEDWHFLEFIEYLFEQHYDGNVGTCFGPILREFYRYRVEPFITVQTDKYKVRVNFGERIKQLRELKGLDAKTVAARAGIQESNLTRIEQGRYAANLDLLTNIAFAMGMKLDFVDIKGDEYGRQDVD